ncbi:MAG: alpha-amylase family glycosyl hydrolase [Saprospiraceae bacterium]
MNDKFQKSTWWKETVFYQIYMPSFCDGNGDGYSDFKGMTGKLDYLQTLGIKGIWLTPFLQSPKVDNGYDVSSYMDIDTTYGTTDDFITFLDAAHHRGIKVIIDMVFNHTSTDHAWFRESRKSLDNSYREYYIWRDTTNNWESFFGGSAWEPDPLTNQYYYHKFDRTMADLNWSNPKVVVEIQNVLRYWLDIGVDGFRLDVINFLTTDQDWNDNSMEDGKQIHRHDIDQKGVKDAMRMIKSTVSEYKDRFIVGEIGSDKIEVLSQYQAADLLDVVFNFNFGSIPEFSAERISNQLMDMEIYMKSHPTLFFSSHDMPRMMDRLADGNEKKALALAALTLTARGIPFIYYGEEIGMRDIEANTIDEMIDVQGRTQYELARAQGLNETDALAEANKHNRDKSRSPMQWNADSFAGFSAKKPWIKIHEDYEEINVEMQMEDSTSIWNGYKTLISLRNGEKALQYGEYEELTYSDDRISFTRTFENEKITVNINFGERMNIDIPADAVCLFGNALLEQDEIVIYRLTSK